MADAIKRGSKYMDHKLNREYLTGRVCVFPAVFAVTISCCNGDRLYFFMWKHNFYTLFGLNSLYQGGK